jgi:hypothetical protein
MNEVLELAVSAHGGLDRWKRIRSIDVSLIISGQLLEVRGFPEHQHTKVTIDADRPRTVMKPYGEEGARGIYTPDRVGIEARDDGREIVELRDPTCFSRGRIHLGPGLAYRRSSLGHLKTRSQLRTCRIALLEEHRTEVGVRGGSVREQKVVVEKDADASRSEPWRAEERQAYNIKRSRVRLRVGCHLRHVLKSGGYDVSFRCSQPYACRRMF